VTHHDFEQLELARVNSIFFRSALRAGSFGEFEIGQLQLGIASVLPESPRRASAYDAGQQSTGDRLGEVVVAPATSP